jgi:S-DNA-T family DNA segregation ATPase FtsK/SpoIIIE
MSYPDNPERDEAAPAAEVVPFPQQRPAPPEETTPAKARTSPAGDEDQNDDHESVVLTPEALGRPVDPPDEPASLRARLARRDERRPVIPPGYRTRIEIKTTAEWAVRQAGYVAAYHGVRVPKYAAKTAVYAPPGFVLTLGRMLRWATAEEGNWALRQDAATRNDAETWLRLDKQRQRQSTARWPLVIATLVAALIGVLVLAFGPVPDLWRWGVLCILVPVFARLGRPADKPITDRVSEGKKYRKLTAELVRRSLTSIGLAGINQAVAKNPGAISFPQEIHRDGPGHLAVVDLPYGVEAADVIARRGRLASGLRLPLDQVWPEPAPGHTGRLALWVGHEPASQMRQPAWSLLRDGKVDVFKPFPFATTPRLEVINAEIMFRNWLFGGQPGSGKTFALRLLVLAVLLDVRVELRGYELKGVGDFKVLAPLCTEYGNGFDDDTLSRCAAMITWLYAECERRSKRIDHYAALGKAPENKVTPELASLKGSGLHPLVIFIDEVQELFQHPRYGKEAGEILEKVIKLGRALGVTVLLGTQIPDKDSLPTGITRNVNTRFCLSVADQVANDMILGTSAYKLGHRATVFEPVTEAGWGILAGIGKPAARRSFNVDTDKAKRVVERATALRDKAGTLPVPQEQTRQVGPGLDVLADVATIWPAGEERAWNDTLCTRLADYRPDSYAGWRSEQLTAALKPHGIPVTDIGRRIDGKPVTRRGISRTDITTAVAERNRRRRSD